jgi:hypothetical protein
MNADRPNADQTSIRVNGAPNFGYTVEEYIGNAFTGSWHAVTCRYEFRHLAEAAMLRLARYTVEKVA